jgi:tetratricopeptide (TPR) repeat protein
MLWEEAGSNAGSLAGAGKFEEAAAELEKVLTKYPEEREVCGSALSLEITIWARQAKDYGRAIATFERFLADYPEQVGEAAWARVEMAGDCYFPSGDYPAGLATLLEMVVHSGVYEGSGTAGPGVPFQPWAEQRVRSYLKKVAGAFAKQGKPEEFAHLIRGALANSFSAPVIELLAGAMLELKQGLGVPRTAEEEAWYGSLVAVYKDWQHNLGTTLPELFAYVHLAYGEGELAKEACQQVPGGKIHTKEGTRIAMLLAHILKAEGDFKGCLEAYQGVLKTLGEEYPLRDALMGVLVTCAGRVEDQQAVEKMGGQIEDYCLTEHAEAEAAGSIIRLTRVLNALAQSLFARGEYAGAGALYEAELAMPVAEEHRVTVEMNAVYAFMAGGNPEEAIALCEKVLAAYPGRPEALEAQFAIAGCRAYQGRYAEARETLQKIIDEHPGASAAADAQRYLDSLPK